MTITCTNCQYDNNPTEARECANCGAELSRGVLSAELVEQTVALPVLVSDAVMIQESRPRQRLLHKLWRQVSALVSQAAPRLAATEAAPQPQQRRKGTIIQFVGVIAAQPIEQAAMRPPDLRISSTIVGIGATALLVGAVIGLLRGLAPATTLGAAVVVLVSMISSCLLGVDIIEAFWHQRTNRHETRLRWWLIFCLSIGSFAVLAVPAPMALLMSLFGLCLALIGISDGIKRRSPRDLLARTILTVQEHQGKQRSVELYGFDIAGRLHLGQHVTVHGHQERNGIFRAYSVSVVGEEYAEQPMEPYTVPGERSFVPGLAKKIWSVAGFAALALLIVAPLLLPSTIASGQRNTAAQQAMAEREREPTQGIAPNTATRLGMEPAASPVPKPVVGYDIYVVKPGDELRRIPRPSGVTNMDIIALNKDRYPRIAEPPYYIYAGWKLRIPRH